MTAIGIPYSHTSLNDYSVCPKRFYHRYVAKNAPTSSFEKKSEQQLWGIKAHEAVKKRIKIREELPEEFRQFEKLMRPIEDPNAIRYVEEKLAIREDGSPCPYDAKDAWLRGILDLAMSKALDAAAAPTCVLIDWKTGKCWEDATELAIQALLYRANRPETLRITGFYMWLRECRPGTLHESIDDTGRTLEAIRGKVKSLEGRVKSGDWPADDGPLCPWCPTSMDRNHPAYCEHRREPNK
jgi:hypothetical protein